MNEMLVSWKYVIITDKGLEKIFEFESIDCIKLELTFQVFVNLMKSKDEKKEIYQKFKIVIV